MKTLSMTRNNDFLRAYRRGVLCYAKPAWNNPPWSYDQQEDRKRSGKKPCKKGLSGCIQRDCSANFAGV